MEDNAFRAPPSICTHSSYCECPQDALWHSHNRFSYSAVLSQEDAFPHLLSIHYQPLLPLSSPSQASRPPTGRVMRRWCHLWLSPAGRVGACYDGGACVGVISGVRGTGRTGVRNAGLACMRNLGVVGVPWGADARVRGGHAEYFPSDDLVLWVVWVVLKRQRLRARGSSPSPSVSPACSPLRFPFERPSRLPKPPTLPFSTLNPSEFSGRAAPVCPALAA